MPAFIKDIAINLIASIIYNPTKFMVGKMTDNLFWKKQKAKHQLSDSQNDFLDRYAEALVEFAKTGKPKHVLKFFGYQAILQLMEYYATNQVDKTAFDQEIGQL